MSKVPRLLSQRLGKVIAGTLNKSQIPTQGKVRPGQPVQGILGLQLHTPSPSPDMGIIGTTKKKRKKKEEEH